MKTPKAILIVHPCQTARPSGKSLWMHAHLRAHFPDVELSHAIFQPAYPENTAYDWIDTPAEFMNSPNGA